MPKSRGRKKNTKRIFKIKVAQAQFKTHYKAKRFGLALKILQDCMAQGYKSASILTDAAVCCVYSERWSEAILYGKQALELQPEQLTALDALAHATGAQRDWDGVKRYGSQALDIRAKIMVADVTPLPFPLNTPTREAKIDVIAISLFGDNSKYCETAILNAVEQPRLYPGWQVWVYVDETVPTFVINRLEKAGAKVLPVDEELSQWPGPMWRFAAIDDPRTRRVIFRDADSVISAREAGAVAEWVESTKGFHLMRDNGSHTELMLAGLWGVRKGSLPRIRDLVAVFLEKPVEDAHFADQYFLRKFVWPFARENLLEHDSLFGWADGRAFPEGPHRDDFHVGYAEGSPFVTLDSQLPDNSSVEWYLWDIEHDAEICRYPGKVVEGKIIAHMPARFARRILDGTLQVKYELPK